MRELIVRNFEETVASGTPATLALNAGKFSRAAIIAAFELVGGLEKFAAWAEINQTEFYTKLFPKLIGRETVDTHKPDAVEDLLTTIDGEATEVSEVPEESLDDLPEDKLEASVRPVGGGNISMRLAERAAQYAKAEAA